MQKAFGWYFLVAVFFDVAVAVLFCEADELLVAAVAAAVFGTVVFEADELDAEVVVVVVVEEVAAIAAAEIWAEEVVVVDVMVAGLPEFEDAVSEPTLGESLDGVIDC